MKLFKRFLPLERMVQFFLILGVVSAIIEWIRGKPASWVLFFGGFDLGLALSQEFIIRYRRAADKWMCICMELLKQQFGKQEPRKRVILKLMDDPRKN